MITTDWNTRGESSADCDPFMVRVRKDRANTLRGLLAEFDNEMNDLGRQAEFLRSLIEEVV